MVSVIHAKSTVLLQSQRSLEGLHLIFVLCGPLRNAQRNCAALHARVRVSVLATWVRYGAGDVALLCTSLPVAMRDVVCGDVTWDLVKW